MVYCCTATYSCLLQLSWFCFCVIWTMVIILICSFCNGRAINYHNNCEIVMMMISASFLVILEIVQNGRHKLSYKLSGKSNWKSYAYGPAIWRQYQINWPWVTLILPSCLIPFKFRTWKVHHYSQTSYDIGIGKQSVYKSPICEAICRLKYRNVSARGSFTADQLCCGAARRRACTYAAWCGTLRHYGDMLRPAPRGALRCHAVHMNEVSDAEMLI